jgi:hypothetical protein
VFEDGGVGPAGALQRVGRHRGAAEGVLVVAGGGKPGDGAAGPGEGDDSVSVTGARNPQEKQDFCWFGMTK